MARQDYNIYFVSGYQLDKDVATGLFIVTDANDVEVESGNITTTNTNFIRSHIECAIEALKKIPYGASVHFITDLTYMVNIINHQWFIRANQDLWEKFESVARVGRHKCTAEWRGVKAKDPMLRRCWRECGEVAGFDFIAYFESHPRK